MAERAVRADSCCGGQATDTGSGGESGTGFEDRAALGGRRRLLVRRVLLGASALFALSAVAVTIAGLAPWVADRLAWAASIWVAGLVLGWVRQVLAQRRLDWRLAVVMAAVVVGVLWQPLVAALVAVALLAEQVLRSPWAETRTASSVPSHLAGQAG
ncbi:hypothetical protein [Actinophytocola sp. NPDC049390]|uniref:hypothetical protein n=1 Tax=Actinophytocola sp. NPDC049390 TaxID=3363894 RepID=UPI00378EBBE6